MAHQKIRILQNIEDKFHFENHFLPLVRSFDKNDNHARNFKFEITSDSALKHSPPGRQLTHEWIMSSLASI